METMEDMDLERMMEEKYRKVYSERLGRYVFVLRSWVEESVFKRHKELFGYTDIGWTVKHPNPNCISYLSLLEIFEFQGV